MNRQQILALAAALLVSACATKLQEAPTQEAVIEDALPETTQIRAGWAAPTIILRSARNWSRWC